MRAAVLSLGPSMEFNQINYKRRCLPVWLKPVHTGRSYRVLGVLVSEGVTCVDPQPHLFLPVFCPGHVLSPKAPACPQRKQEDERACALPGSSV